MVGWRFPWPSGEFVVTDRKDGFVLIQNRLTCTRTAAIAYRKPAEVTSTGT
jgi:hypothetical protein